MKWKKLGQIFDPRDHRLLDGCSEFAQSPQAVVFDHFVRVYFSTRSKDSTGKYLSHVAFADFDKQFSRVLDVSRHVVIDLGELGAFDEHGIFPFSPLNDGSRLLAYTTGWNRRVSVSVDAAIGLAISRNGGRTFEKVGTGPVLCAFLHEPFLVADAFVQIFDGTYHMWYIFGTQWTAVAPGARPDRIYKIGHAISRDGVSWQRESRQIIADRLDETECQALPSVVRVGDEYRMFFCYRRQFDFRTDRNSAYRIGYACSRDLKNWVRDDATGGIEVSVDGWDSDMQCYPFIFRCDERIYLLYNGNEFGRHGFGLAVSESVADL